MNGVLSDAGDKPMNEWKNWERDWNAVAEVIDTRGGTIHRLIVEPPATLAELRDVESTIGSLIPESMSRVMLEFSRSVDFSWSLPEEIELPDECAGVEAGSCVWDLSQIAEYEKNRQEWVSSCFDDPDDPYDQVWRNKMAFFSAINGDNFAIELMDPSRRGKVIYLSHEDGPGHDFVLGSCFADYVNRVTTIGCVGAEDDQWIAFCEDHNTGLTNQGAAGRAWDTWLGIDLKSKVVAVGKAQQ